MNIPQRYSYCVLVTAILAIIGYFISPLLGLGIAVGGLISPLLTCQCGSSASQAPVTPASSVGKMATPSIKPSAEKAPLHTSTNVADESFAADRPVITRAEYDGEVKTIYVGNLPYRANEAAIRSLFAEHGLVLSVRLVKDRDTGKRRGYGFVEMPSDSADSAIATLNETEYLQRTLKVREANEKKELRPEDESSNSAEL
jgi:hypothetical protein